MDFLFFSLPPVGGWQGSHAGVWALQPGYLNEFCVGSASFFMLSHSVDLSFQVTTPVTAAATVTTSWSSSCIVWQLMAHIFYMWDACKGGNHGRAKRGPYSAL